MNRRNFLKAVAGSAVVAGGARVLTPACARADHAAREQGAQGTHHVYDFKGSPFEIGFQHGKALRDEIVREAGSKIKTLAHSRATSVEKALDFVVASYEPLFRDHTPMALEEIQGMAKGSGLGYPYAFFAATHDGMAFPAAKADGCTAITCGKPVTAGGKVFVGQNKDTHAPLDRYRIMRVAYNSGRRMIVLNYPGWIANLCLTSDGIATTGNSLFARSDAADILPMSLLKRLIMEKSTVREILDAIAKLPFTNGCFNIGDATGHTVCLESVNGKMNVRDTSQQAFGHANTILCEDFKSMENGTVPACSPIRQRNVQDRLDAKRGHLTAADLQKIFADHADFPLSICRHHATDSDGTTTASFVANVTDREMDIAIGNPCTAPYRRYTMDF